MTAMKSVTIEFHHYRYLSYTFEPHYFIILMILIGNGTKHHCSPIPSRYRINEHWLPYFELRWL